MKNLLSILFSLFFSVSVLAQVTATSESFESCDYDAYNEDFVNCTSVDLNSTFVFDIEESEVRFYTDENAKTYLIEEFEIDENETMIFNLVDTEDDSNRFILLFNEEEMLIMIIPEDINNQQALKFYLSQLIY
ncbi:MAG: hypothetical protein IAE91_12165 [Ignavibacteriaceae bacterium]|nr:hypothetical protein [Ignavibacteriaceae bacterium]